MLICFCSIHVGRADFGLFQSGVSDLTRSLLPETLEAQVAAQQGVAQTAVLFLYVTDIGGDGVAQKIIFAVEARLAAGDDDDFVGGR